MQDQHDLGNIQSLPVSNEEELSWTDKELLAQKKKSKAIKLELTHTISGAPSIDDKFKDYIRKKLYEK